MTQRGRLNVSSGVIIFIATLWEFIVHANVPWRFGPLKWLIATPVFHHWHHANDGKEYINRNYASMLLLSIISLALSIYQKINAVNASALRHRCKTGWLNNYFFRFKVNSAYR
jgi:hypothetical protein